jgi:hypothetical protein
MARPKKRMGRPTKTPKEGVRVSLGLRVTADVKRKLEAAAISKGRSISQEAEMRLEQSLASDKHLLISMNGEWGPILFHGNTMMISVGEFCVVEIPISPQQKEALLNGFNPERAAQEWLDAKKGGHL